MGKRSCVHAVEKIYYYLDGEITWYRRVRINWHLRSCQLCEGAFDFEDRLRSVIRANCSEEIPDDLINRLRSIISDE
ncbi:MAG: hypothetical protein OEX97_02555 [Acidimicrobiia bacterium]|nr:hypothetical protein [Acidimicrobiia bacterium]